ncbi:helix-turn-helix transcriptional regulator [Clostridium sp. AN503]|uniref:helix-turn-helix domain-containing protein n=1 Tax=Clostridium sp. AN503 TaxID=3160598 RepID=UPI00345A85A4
MINERLKSLRLENNLTQAALADKIGIAKTTIASYEQGINEPNIGTLIKISDYFHVTIDYLVGKSNYKNVQEEVGFKNTIVLSDEQELLVLFKKITSCYEFLNHLYIDNNISPSYTSLSKQLVRHLEIVLDAYQRINECSPETIEDIGSNIGAFFMFINLNFDCMKLGCELTHVYKSLIELPVDE